MTITRTQRKVLTFIQDHHLRHGYCPSLQDVADGCGLSARATTHRIVHALAEAGVLRLHPGRRYELVRQNSVSLNLPNDMAADLRALAKRVGVTVEAVAIECIRDGLTAFRARRVSRETAEITRVLSA